MQREGLYYDVEFAKKEEEESKLDTASHVYVMVSLFEFVCGCVYGCCKRMKSNK